MKSRFTAMLLEANALDSGEFQSWAFCPGMRFGSTRKWWGDRGRRDFPHEGIDFCLYRDSAGRLRRLDETTRIPVMLDGVVRARFKDYLGQAVIVEHSAIENGEPGYLSVYAHTEPRGGIIPGARVKEGDVLATLADTSRSKARILPHLHLTLARPLPGLVYEPFVWDIMRDPARVSLLDPAGVIDRPWQALDPRERLCTDL